MPVQPQIASHSLTRPPPTLTIAGTLSHWTRKYVARSDALLMLHVVSGGFERGCGAFAPGTLKATEATLALGGLCDMCPCGRWALLLLSCILCMQVGVVFVDVNGVVGVACWCYMSAIIVVFVGVLDVVNADYSVLLLWLLLLLLWYLLPSG